MEIDIQLTKALEKIGINVFEAPWERTDYAYKGQILTQEEYKKIMEVVEKFRDKLDYFYEDSLPEEFAEAIINDLEEEGIDTSRFKTALKCGETLYEMVIEP